MTWDRAEAEILDLSWYWSNSRSPWYRSPYFQFFFSFTKHVYKSLKYPWVNVGNFPPNFRIFRHRSLCRRLTSFLLRFTCPTNSLITVKKLSSLTTVLSSRVTTVISSMTIWSFWVGFGIWTGYVFAALFFGASLPWSWSSGFGLRSSRFPLTFLLGSTLRFLARFLFFGGTDSFAFRFFLVLLLWW